MPQTSPVNIIFINSNPAHGNELKTIQEILSEPEFENYSINIIEATDWQKAFTVHNKLASAIVIITDKETFSLYHPLTLKHFNQSLQRFILLSEKDNIQATYINTTLVDLSQPDKSKLYKYRITLKAYITTLAKENNAPTNN